MGKKKIIYGIIISSLATAAIVGIVLLCVRLFSDFFTRWPLERSVNSIIRSTMDELECSPFELMDFAHGFAKANGKKSVNKVRVKAIFEQDGSIYVSCVDQVADDVYNESISSEQYYKINDEYKNSEERIYKLKDIYSWEDRCYWYSSEPAWLNLILTPAELRNILNEHLERPQYVVDWPYFSIYVVNDEIFGAIEACTP